MTDELKAPTSPGIPLGPPRGHTGPGATKPGPGRIPKIATVGPPQPAAQAHKKQEQSPEEETPRVPNTPNAMHHPVQDPATVPGVQDSLQATGPSNHRAPKGQKSAGAHAPTPTPAMRVGRGWNPRDRLNVSPSATGRRAGRTGPLTGQG